MKFLAVFLLTTVFLSAHASAGEITVEEFDGGSNITVLSSSIKVNDGSSLRKTFYVLNDSSAPAQLNGVGVETRYDDRSYDFVPQGTVEATEDIQAIQIVYILFDVFGNRLTRLGSTIVEDISANSSYSHSRWAAWRASESDVEQYLISVSYISHARRNDGSIWRADPREIEAQVRELPIVVDDSTFLDDSE